MNKVFYKHSHYWYNNRVNHITYCLLIGDDPLEYAMGIAQCSPMDEFNKKVGRNLAYQRALSSLNDKCDIPVNNYYDENKTRKSLYRIKDYKALYKPINYMSLPVVFVKKLERFGTIISRNQNSVLLYILNDYRTKNKHSISKESLLKFVNFMENNYNVLLDYSKSVFKF